MILGPSQIRRVPLSRISVNGQVSYQALREISIKYAYPTSSNDTDDFDCALTYHDVDNDVVTIASNEELIDAIEQFSPLEKPVLKISTVVVMKRNTINSYEKKKSDDSSNDVNEKKVPNFISDATEDKPRQLQGFVDSCFTVETTAVENFKTTISKGDSSPPSGTNKGPDNPMMNKDDLSNNERDEAKSYSVKPPFIHGRHTCDACYKTPIVGQRFHSTNFPDYDLCADCRGNYKGKEILFEVVELGKLLIQFS
jgi:Zinc finger, ZZ type/PB1 domain